VAELPTISVILPTRDRPDLLREAAESVLAQEPPPRELLIVDDGHHDEAAAVVRRLPPRDAISVRLLQGPGRGPAAARNVGLQEARGEVLAFLDDDDLWLPEKLRRQVVWFARRPEVGVVGTLCVRTRDPAAVSVRSRRQADPLRKITRLALLRANRLTMSSVVARRACFEAGRGFDESLMLAQDWDMWLRISVCWQVGIVPAALTVHRLHGGQRSADHLAMREGEVQVLRRELSRCAAGACGLGALRRRLAWAHCRVGRLVARAGETARAVEELRRSMALFPYNPMTWCSLLRCALAQREPAGVEQ